MRHRVFGRKLNRSSNHRKALYKNTAAALITNGEITTTLAKAKTVQPIVEKLITRAKTEGLHSRRIIHAFFNNHVTTNKLVDQIAPQLSGRKSGYTRLAMQGYRRGDNAMMAKVTFVDQIDFSERVKVVAKPVKAVPEKAITKKPTPVKTKKAE